MKYVVLQHKEAMLLLKSVVKLNTERRMREAQRNTQDCREIQRDNIGWSRRESAEQTEKRDTIRWLSFLERKRREAQEMSA
ncbi:hypothetical protein Bca4012_065127 [Brassica carinata]